MSSLWDSLNNLFGPGTVPSELGERAKENQENPKPRGDGILDFLFNDETVDKWKKNHGKRPPAKPLFDRMRKQSMAPSAPGMMPAGMRVGPPPRPGIPGSQQPRGDFTDRLGRNRPGDPTADPGMLTNPLDMIQDRQAKEQIFQEQKQDVGQELKSQSLRQLKDTFSVLTGQDEEQVNKMLLQQNAFHNRHLPGAFDEDAIRDYLTEMITRASTQRQLPGRNI